MPDTVLTGILVTVLAGIVMGTSPRPLKLMRQFQYEHFAFISMLTALLIIPWGITLSMCPNVFSALVAGVLSVGWGFAFAYAQGPIISEGLQSLAHETFKPTGFSHW